MPSLNAVTFIHIFLCIYLSIIASSNMNEWTPSIDRLHFHTMHFYSSMIFRLYFMACTNFMPFNVSLFHFICGLLLYRCDTHTWCVPYDVYMQLSTLMLQLLLYLCLFHFMFLSVRRFLIQFDMIDLIFVLSSSLCLVISLMQDCRYLLLLSLTHFLYIFFSPLVHFCQPTCVTMIWCIECVYTNIGSFRSILWGVLPTEYVFTSITCHFEHFTSDIFTWKWNAFTSSMHSPSGIISELFSLQMYSLMVVHHYTKSCSQCIREMHSIFIHLHIQPSNRHF